MYELLVTLGLWQYGHDARFLPPPTALPLTDTATPPTSSRPIYRSSLPPISKPRQRNLTHRDSSVTFTPAALTFNFVCNSLLT